MSEVPHGAILFPAYKKRQAGRIITRAALELGWPTGISFDGTHTLRHGGTGVVMENAVNMISNALTGMSHQVRQSHYLAPRRQ